MECHQRFYTPITLLRLNYLRNENYFIITDAIRIKRFENDTLWLALIFYLKYGCVQYIKEST